jgi:hypothetical protein
MMSTKRKQRQNAVRLSLTKRRLRMRLECPPHWGMKWNRHNTNRKARQRYARL